jgi:signal transduction histidine kinase
VKLRLQWLAPGGEVLFDSQAPGVTPPLALADLAKGLAPGEKLNITRQGAVPTVMAQLQGHEAQAEPAAPWLTRLILRLPADTSAVRLSASDEVATPNARYRLQLTGDLQSVDRSLGATATRLSWFVGAMLAAIALAWLIIDVGLVRRVAVLTQRAAALQYNMQDPQVERRLGDLEVADLRGPDELGILAGSLAALLQRVKDGARREHIRAEQELDRWHAVGHEIMSPLQSLMVLHGASDDPSHRYVQRMQQAVRVLYGTASPSEAIESATLAVGTLDLNAFLQHVASNAPFAGIANVHYSAQPQAVMVRADEYSLEDAVTHVLRNADRHRVPGSPITLTLAGDARMAELRIHNLGPGIDASLLERVFDYGVSDQDPNTTGERRGQGLFVARTYMAKMDGTIGALNLDDGVAFVLRLVRAA